MHDGGENVVASAEDQIQDGMDRSAEQHAESACRRKKRKGLRFSLKAILLLTALFCFGLTRISDHAIRSHRAIEVLEGSGGQVRSYRNTWYAKLTPGWLQNGIGKEYFRTPTVIDLEICLRTDSDEASDNRHALHNARRVIESLSYFKRLEILELRLTELDSLAQEDDPTGKIDVSSLRGLQVDRLDLRGSNRMAADFIDQMQVGCLSIYQCEVTERFANSIIRNRHVHTLNFRQARILADKLLKLNEMKNLRSIQFSECRPVENKFGAFDILSAPGAKVSGSPLAIKANDWLQLNLPKISIKGLGL